MSVSAVVIALNEEVNIAPCLQTLSFADEIVVIDGGSVDKTYDLARSFTEKVYQRNFDDFSSQKNFAIEKASSEWIFSVDADERVSRALVDEIKRLINQHSDCAAYAIQRKTRLFGRLFQCSGLQADRPVRFFKKGRAHFERPVHEILKVDGQIGLLKETLEHVSFQTFREYLRRLQLYTSLETAGARKNSKPHFFARPFYRFFTLYVIKQGFRDGIEGFFYCVLSGYYEFIRRAKLWEKTVGRTHG